MKRQVMMADAVVVGGGISGLSTAYGLQRKGHNVIVLERQVRVGGTAQSERIDGFLMEHGPSSVAGDSVATDALSGSLGIDGLQCNLGAGIRYRYLVRDGAPKRISVHPLGMLTSDYLSPRARARVAAEAFIPARPDDGDESVADFFLRRFGREFVDRVVEPLTAGLLAAEASQLSMRTTFPRLCDLERRHGSITWAVIRRSLAGARMPARRLYSWSDGVGTLPRALAARLGAAVKTGAAVRRIAPIPGGFRVEAGKGFAVTTQTVILGTQAHVAVSLLEGIDLPAAEALAGIEAPPIAVVFLGYARHQVGHPLDGLGYLTPSLEQRPVSGVLFCSTMFAGRAPEGYAALAAYVGGARSSELARLPSGDLIALVQNEFKETLQVRGQPVLARVRQWSRGLPQPRLGHGERIAELERAQERWPGLFITGNYFARPSVAHCIAQADQTVQRVDHYLVRPDRSPVSAETLRGDEIPGRFKAR